MKGVCCLALPLALACESDLQSSPPPPFDLLTTGRSHTCARAPTGRPYCWGTNDSGQLGVGEADTAGHPRPLLLPGNLVVALMSAFRNHTCAVTADRRAYCWGANGSGQLGAGDSVNRAEATEVGGDVPFTSIAAGGDHTCALRTDSTAYCWGDNSAGQLGTGTSAAAVVPQPVSGGLKFVAIATGGRHTCALMAGGEAHCWGAGGEGQLGTGDMLPSGSPVAVNTTLRFAGIAAGDAHTCGLTETGDVACWGRGTQGQLGAGPISELCGGTPCSKSPIPIQSGASFITLTAGATHTCAATRDALAYCWGGNADGQLGVAFTRDACNGDPCSLEPIGVTGSASLIVLSAGGSHTCGFSNTADPYCWGANDRGQLGDGSRLQTATPVRVVRP